MASGAGNDLQREREREQRDFDLLKHVSTLNVISLVLVQTLLAEFPEQTRTTLWIFGGSLLIAMVGLALTLLGRGWKTPVRVITFLAYMVFLFGLLSALFPNLADRLK